VKIKELIEKLQQHDPEMLIFVNAYLHNAISIPDPVIFGSKHRVDVFRFHKKKFKEEGWGDFKEFMVL
jgi:hypothetical protein